MAFGTHTNHAATEGVQFDTLSAATLEDVRSEVRVPGYHRSAVQTGIVHLGPGAFHRAHQAAYVDSLLESDPRWGICGVSLNSAAVRDALKPQDCLYSLSILDNEPSQRIIGSLTDVLLAREQLDKVLAVMAAETTKIVSLTVTENGYCLTPDGDLDTSRPEIQYDLNLPSMPTSSIGLIVEALARRYRQGTAPFTVLSCDNLADNGRKLRRGVLQFAREVNADLALWIEGCVPFPCSMVDSITPATDNALRLQAAKALGLKDAWPIQREAFSQWVIEDSFIERPALDRVGVQFTSDVAGYEACKLHLLNGTHSTLAYLGLLTGYEAVNEAIADEVLEGLLKTMMQREIIPTLTVPADMNVTAYAESVLARYRNPGIRHLLSQIAWDGSQKLPVRIMPIIEKNLQANRPVKGLVTALAAWLRFLEMQAKADVTLKDPLADKLIALVRGFSGDSSKDTHAFVQASGVFPAGLRSSPKFLALLAACHTELAAGKGNVDRYVKSILETS